jgi:hypothetical protein
MVLCGLLIDGGWILQGVKSHYYLNTLLNYDETSQKLYCNWIYRKWEYLFVVGRRVTERPSAHNNKKHDAISFIDRLLKSFMWHGLKNCTSIYNRARQPNWILHLGVLERKSKSWCYQEWLTFYKTKTPLKWSTPISIRFRCFMF